jgi:hypothetical protein
LPGGRAAGIPGLGREAVVDEYGVTANHAQIDGALSAWPSRSRHMKKRPTSVTVIGWILIVMAALAAVAMPIGLNDPKAREMMKENPIPVPVQLVMSVVGIVVMGGCGAAILMGKNWARILYAVWSGVGFAVSLVTSPMKLMLIPGLIVCVIIIVFLFLPNANAYFSPPKVDHDQNAR